MLFIVADDDCSTQQTAIAIPRKITRPDDFNDAPNAGWLSFPEALGARKHLPNLDPSRASVFPNEIFSHV